MTTPYVRACRRAVLHAPLDPVARVAYADALEAAGDPTGRLWRTPFVRTFFPVGPDGRPREFEADRHYGRPADSPLRWACPEDPHGRDEYTQAMLAVVCRDLPARPGWGAEVWMGGVRRLRVPALEFEEYAGRVFARHPVVRVASDREPAALRVHTTGFAGVVWRCDSSGDVSRDRVYLPHGVAPFLGREDASDPDSWHGDLRWDYPTYEVAFQRLSLAWVDYGRRLAGLRKRPDRPRLAHRHWLVSRETAAFLRKRAESAPPG